MNQILIENHLYAKDLYEAKYQVLIKKRESTALRYFSDSKAFIEYFNDMDDIYENIEEYNPNKRWKILVIFDNMIADVLSNKKLNLIVNELFIRGRKLNKTCFYHTTVLRCSENIRLNSAYYFVMKIANKRELQQIVFNHSLDIDFKDFMNLYKKYTAKPYSFLVTDTALASDNSSCFRNNFFERI